jgi:hypothetical protein
LSDESNSFATQSYNYESTTVGKKILADAITADFSKSKTQISVETESKIKTAEN